MSTGTARASRLPPNEEKEGGPLRRGLSVRVSEARTLLRFFGVAGGGGGGRSGRLSGNCARICVILR